MADAGHQLMIKYGLPRAPDQDLIDRWARRVAELIAQNVGADQAGRMAASAIFPGYETCKYASEADAIEAILQAARDRGK